MAISKIHSFKHFNFEKYKIDFFKQTAIIMWSNTVDEDYDKDYSYKSQKRAILDKLNNSEVFDSKFILLQGIFPAEYTNLPVEKETMELYIQFKDNLTTREKKEKIRLFIDKM